MTFLIFFVVKFNVYCHFFNNIAFDNEKKLTFAVGNSEVDGKFFRVMQCIFLKFCKFFVRLFSAIVRSIRLNC